MSLGPEKALCQVTNAVLGHHLLGRYKMFIVLRNVWKPTDVLLILKPGNST